MSAPKLRHNPYAIFEDSQSPLGLYARQKWLNQGETETYEADFAAAVAKLRYADMNPGNRSERILEQLHRLFGRVTRPFDIPIIRTLERIQGQTPILYDLDNFR
jgi:hypothetical protein